MTYKVEVDEKTCIGCGSCEHVSDGFFTIEEKEIDGDEKFIAIPKQKTVEEVSSMLNEAKEICPVEAIKITEIKGGNGETTDEKEEVKEEVKEEENEEKEEVKEEEKEEN